MKLVVTKKSAITKNGNAILSLKSVEPTITKTAFGVKKSNKFFLMAVDFEDSADVGFEADINLNDYKVEMRESITDDGEVLSLPWLTTK